MADRNFGRRRNGSGDLNQPRLERGEQRNLVRPCRRGMGVMPSTTHRNTTCQDQQYAGGGVPFPDCERTTSAGGDRQQPAAQGKRQPPVDEDSTGEANHSDDRRGSASRPLSRDVRCVHWDHHPPLGKSDGISSASVRDRFRFRLKDSLVRLFSSQFLIYWGPTYKAATHE